MLASVAAGAPMPKPLLLPLPTGADAWENDKPPVAAAGAAESFPVASADGAALAAVFPKLNETAGAGALVGGAKLKPAILTIIVRM